MLVALTRDASEARIEKLRSDDEGWQVQIVEGPARAIALAPDARLTAAGVRRPEFIKVPMPDGVQLDAYRIVPPAFDSTRKYPVLMYVYGGPASPQVNDAWGGTRFLWHEMLAQRGYVVVVVDNRGAAWRGRAFRKVTQSQKGNVAVTIEDLSGGDSQLVIERDNGQGREHIGQVGHNNHQPRGRSVLTMTPGRYDVYMADRPENRAVLVVEP